MSKTSSQVKNKYNNKAYDRITIMPKKGSKEKGINRQDFEKQIKSQFGIN